MKKITLFLTPEQITEPFIEELTQMKADYPGNTRLYLSMTSKDNKRPLVLISKSGNVDPRLFLNNLQKRLGPVRYQLSK